MATNVNQRTFNQVGSGILTVATAGTPQPLSEAAISLDRGSIQAITIAFAPAAGSTPAKITDSGGGFVTAGFQKNDSIRVAGSASNDGVYLIENVAAGELILKGDPVVTELAGATVTIFRAIRVESIVLWPSASGAMLSSDPTVPAASTPTLLTTDRINILLGDLSTVYADVATDSDTINFYFIYQ